MQPTNPFVPIIFAAAMSLHPAVYAGDTSETVKFVPKQLVGSGWVNLQTPAGQYVYGEETPMRRPIKAFPIGKFTRSEYSLFSLQEEEALWRYEQSQIEAEEAANATEAEKEKKTAVRHAQAGTKIPKIEWPRVILKDGGIVCVPEISSSDADDWRDHLICTEVTERE